MADLKFGVWKGCFFYDPVTKELTDGSDIVATESERLANESHIKQDEFIECLREFIRGWDEGWIVIYEPDLTGWRGEEAQEVIDKFNGRARLWLGMEETDE